MLSEDNKKIKLISEMLKDKRKRLLGHVMRCENSDPLYQVTFKDEGGYKQFDHKRVGRPRGHWAEETMKETMEWMEGAEFDKEDIYHHIFLFSAAISRSF